MEARSSSCCVVGWGVAVSLFEGAAGGRWFLLEAGVAVARAGGCGLEASLGIKGVLFVALAAEALREGICGLLLAEFRFYQIH